MQDTDVVIGIGHSTNPPCRQNQRDISLTGGWLTLTLTLALILAIPTLIESVDIETQVCVIVYIQKPEAKHWKQLACRPSSTGRKQSIQEEERTTRKMDEANHEASSSIRGLEPGLRVSRVFSQGRPLTHAPRTRLAPNVVGLWQEGI